MTLQEYSLAEKFTRFARRQFHWRLTPVKYNFMKALSDGDMDHVKWTINLFPEAINWQGGQSLHGTWEGSIPITTAFFARNCAGGNVAMLDFMMDCGADPNRQDQHGNAVLHRAARYRDEAAMAALILRGADPDLKNCKGETPRDWLAKGFNGNAPAADPLIAFIDLQVKKRAEICAAREAAVAESAIRSCTEGTQEAVPVRNRPLKLKKKSKITY